MSGDPLAVLIGGIEKEIALFSAACGYDYIYSKSDCKLIIVCYDY